MSEKFLKARIFAIDRHRIDTDGQGVTTLVCFNGCRLLCEYCINPECWHFGSNDKIVTPEELLDIVKIISISRPQEAESLLAEVNLLYKANSLRPSARLLPPNGISILKHLCLCFISIWNGYFLISTSTSSTSRT